ncbi:nitrate reductase [Phyllobacterium myrsinacearum]|uniref:Assimilatory nitrate reductase catalytic subunit n=1 Tax=Phyllobacterium myrsinacearum TaxID=28101 RepID=A0A839EHX2_9HYPH|nr:nitrate reductase [Phyllobacterium myrsinacearum]MBA8879893.1 assimilatory nitrate reductase catalytic subunit [Phyllobacterium myrsinacearum]
MDNPALSPDTVRTTCPYCGVGCGVLATPGDDGTVAIAGDPDHPANFGRLCSKGSALGETVHLDGRLLEPQIDGRAASWDSALDLVASRFSTAIREHGPDSVAFYVSGQLLTEDYYVANKLMKGFIGSANIDTNSRLCMSSSVAGHMRAFGSDTVPGTYEDLELADLIVLTGSNLAWCHPVLYQRIAAAKVKRPQMRVVLIDPRRTMTADIADMHLQIRPDADTALFVGLLGFLAEQSALNKAYIAQYTTGFEAALAIASPCDLETISIKTGIAPDQLLAFFTLFARTERCVTVYSQGVNQSASGTDKVNAIINCHLATGRIGRPGMGPFSVTGQPNAMGGREVGGLANMLASHMQIENAGHRRLVQDFWASPTMATKAGLKAVDLFKAVGDGRIKALWIMATNPADSMPEADLVAKALKTCPFVVVSDINANTDTTAYAHVLLPAAGWGEKDGTVTNSERRISRQRPFLTLPGEAKPDWWIITEVAKRMGFATAFAYQNPAQIFAEHAALSGTENDGSRDFNIAAHAAISATGYDALSPFQWPQSQRSGSSGGRFFAGGAFFTPDRRARFIAVHPVDTVTIDQRFTLNTGRVRDHWHTMTRTGKSARLSAHFAEPFAEIHPLDAAERGIADASLVKLHNDHGNIIVRALLTDRQIRGSVFVPMHWTNQFSGSARVDILVTSRTDPVSGQPALKMAKVDIRPFEAAWYGFAVLRNKPPTMTTDYWALARTNDGYRIELAGLRDVDDRAAFAEALFGCGEGAPLLRYHDEKNGQHRMAVFAGDGLIGALYIGRQPVAVSRSWASEQLSQSFSAAQSRFQLLAGRPGKDMPDKGAIVCSCFSVGRNEIASAARGGCQTVVAIGEALKAGTNCGSCRAEIRGIVDANLVQAAE